MFAGVVSGSQEISVLLNRDFLGGRPPRWTLNVRAWIWTEMEVYIVLWRDMNCESCQLRMLCLESMTCLFLGEIYVEWNIEYRVEGQLLVPLKDTTCGTGRFTAQEQWQICVVCRKLCWDWAHGMVREIWLDNTRLWVWAQPGVTWVLCGNLGNLKILMSSKPPSYRGFVENRPEYWNY